MDKLDNIGITLLESSSDKERVVSQHVLITGLGRGGTTAMAQVFKAFGFVFDNPNDFMESLELKGFLEKGDTQKLTEKLNQWQSSGLRHAWKDPKLVAAPCRNALIALPRNITTVIIFRDLLATSMRHSSVMSDDFLTSLERYALGVHKLVKLTKQLKPNRSVVLVSYEKLLVNTDVVVNQLASIFQITDTDRITQAINAVAISPQSYLAACRESVSGK